MTGQLNSSVAIGDGAGQNGQQKKSVAIGSNAGENGQQKKSVAIGDCAGKNGQGKYSIAIGYQAGITGQPDKSIILNASNSPLTPADPGFFVNPVKGNTGANNSMSGFKQLYYNPTTHEIVYC